MRYGSIPRGQEANSLDKLADDMAGHFRSGMVAGRWVGEAWIMRLRALIAMPQEATCGDCGCQSVATPEGEDS